MNVNSVSFTGAPKAAKKPLTKGQKAAAITGAVAGTAAVASAVAAFAMGKGADGNNLNKLGAGYKAMGSFVAEKAQDAWIGIQKAFTGFISKFGTTAEEAATLAEDLATMNK